MAYSGDHDLIEHNEDNEVAEDPNPLPMALEFVSMNIVSQAEKRENRKIVRKTVMKNFRREQKSQQAKTKDSTKRPLAPGIRRSSSSLNAQEYSSSSSSSGDSPESTVSGTSLPMRNFSLARHRKNSEDRTVEERYRRVTNVTDTPISSMECSPISPLGAGRVDPFRTYPSMEGPRIHELIDHSTTVIWPGFCPPDTAGPRVRIASAWLAKATEKPLVMHAFLFGATVHLDVLRSPSLSLNNQTRLFHKVQTMRLLKDELESPHSMPLDDLILAVLALGTNEVETFENRLKEKILSPFNSPLTSVQWLEVYGSISHVPAHTIAMRSLVDRRGGLEKIELDGLAEVLSYSDILGATQSMSKPHWPLLSRSPKFNQTNEVADEISFCSLKRLGQAFRSLLGVGIDKHALKVFKYMADLTVVVEAHCRGSKPISDMGQFINRRNFVQHNLMSLSIGKELLMEGKVISDALYEAIRYAAIIFSVAVTFPLPPLSGIFQRLSAAIKSNLDTSKQDPCWIKCTRPLLWILVLGGTAAFNTPDRPWFVKNLLLVSKLLDISEWEVLVKEIEQYLWLERVFDAGGRTLWMEVLAKKELATKASKLNELDG